MLIPQRGRILGFVFAFSATVVVAACGSGADSTLVDRAAASVAVSASAPTSTATSSAAAAASTSTTVTPVPALFDAWTDSDGYSYTFDLDAPHRPSITIDVANARPGQINVTVTYVFTGTLTNTTARRNALFPRNYYVSAIWEADSPVCQGDWIDEPWSTNTPQLKNGFCSVRRGAQFGPANTKDSLTPKIPVNSALTLRASLSRDLTYPDTVDQKELQETLSAPFAYVLGRGGDTTPTPMTSCLLVSGGGFVSAATADTGCFVE